VQARQLPADIPNHFYLASKREEDPMTTKADRAALKTDQQRLEAQLEALYEAWRVRSAPNMRKLFSNDERLLLWGTDRWERIEGRAEADREFDRWIATCPPWTSFEVTHREMDVREGIAWAAEEVIGLWSRETESGATHFRITTGWEEEGGEWKIRHAHIDLPLD
jgi:ketosteroid isomerase-like protein